ncbi:hypothetical protein BpHYR1_000095 [Brachionus plicatilis]|uniref:Uncharacterized protein n=1 Tax=Brachionus plicatilis TaxID=10195 RepID=A0A3M7PNB1_BRAPC|nr:hypothetical protein BpHYR1_000095 [Brachionus plicatilis]
MTCQICFLLRSTHPLSEIKNLSSKIFFWTVLWPAGLHTVGRFTAFHGRKTGFLKKRIREKNLEGLNPYKEKHLRDVNFISLKKSSFYEGLNSILHFILITNVPVLGIKYFMLSESLIIIII